MGQLFKENTVSQQDTRKARERGRGIFPPQHLNFSPIIIKNTKWLFSPKSQRRQSLLWFKVSQHQLQTSGTKRAHTSFSNYPIWIIILKSRIIFFFFFLKADNLPSFREEWRSNLSAQSFYFLDAFLNFVASSCQLRGGNCMKSVHIQECKISASKKKKTKHFKKLDMIIHTLPLKCLKPPGWPWPPGVSGHVIVGHWDEDLPAV